VTASIGLVLAAFAGYMAEAKLTADIIAGAMAGWNKYLIVQLHLMLMGYQAARELERGDIAINVKLFGRLRPLLGRQELSLGAAQGTTVDDLLRNFFNYYPQARPEALERIWGSEDDKESLWMEVVPSYVFRHGWRVLLNGRPIQYVGGFDRPVQRDDTISIFPPTR
jgi:molybdopterin converting factor small subunit